MPNNSFMPATKAGQVAWAAQFVEVAADDPEAAGLTAAQVDAFGVVNTALQAAWAASENPATRTAITIATRDEALANMRAMASKLASIVQGSNATTATKMALGLTIRSTNPSPRPAPSTMPWLQVISITGRSVKLQLRTAQAQRGKPENVTGATVFMHIGPTPPADGMPWTFGANVTKTSVTIPFTPSPTGETAWLTAFWSNAKGQSGPSCQPIKIYLPAADDVPTEVEEAA